MNTEQTTPLLPSPPLRAATGSEIGGRIMILIYALTKKAEEMERAAQGLRNLADNLEAVRKDISPNTEVSEPPRKP